MESENTPENVSVSMVRKRPFKAIDNYAEGNAEQE